MKRLNKTANNATWRDKLKVIEERKETWKTPTQGQTIKTGHSNIMKEILPTSRRKRHLDLPTTGCKWSKLFWRKIWQWKEHNRKAKWINTIEKNHKDSKKPLRWEYTCNRSEQHRKKYWIGKCQSVKEYINSGFKESRPYATNWLFNWVDAKKKQIYPNRW